MSKDLSRRGFLKTVSIGMGAALLSACGPAATQAVKPADTLAPTAQPTAKPPSAEKVSLEFVMNDSPGWADAVNKMMKMYMDKNPNVTLKYNPIEFGQLTTVLPPRFAAKTPPDLLLCDAFWPWVQQGLVLDLQPYIDRDKPDVSQIADMGAGVILGKPTRYGLPFDFTGSVVAYNKTAFEKYGVALPKKDWTMDDFKKAAIALTRDKNDKSPADSGFDPKNIQMYGSLLQNSFFWGALIKMFGGAPWSEDGKTCLMGSPESLKAFTYFNELACTEHALYGPQASPTAGAADPFVSQQVAMTIEGEWQLALYKDIKDYDWDVAAWPNGPAKNFQYGGSDALGIAKDSKFTDSAWEFEKFWIWNKEAALTTGGIMPPALNEAGMDNSILQARTGARGPKMENLVWAYSNMRKVSDCSIAYQSNHSDLWGPVLNELLINLTTLCTDSVEPLVTKAANQITEILQKP